MTAQPIILSEQQEAAAKEAEAWITDPERRARPFILEGYAGTGKSFTVKQIVDRLGRTPWYGAYTGKAALVLREYQGVDAGTIHSKIYRVQMVPDETFKTLYAKRDQASGESEAKEIQAEIDELMRPKFELNPDAFADGEDLIVLDECSMVDQDMLRDLLSFKIPIIALGDPGQLPPVKGEGALFASPSNARLTEIRRQALDNPIIEASMRLRKQQRLPTTDPESWRTDGLAVIPKPFLSHYEGMFEQMYDEHDVLICWKNATRKNLNRQRRRMLGLAQKSFQFPTAGDRIIFTKNDKEEGIFNGLFAIVHEVGETYDTSIELTVAFETAPDTKHTYKFLRAPFEEYDEGKAAFDRLRSWDYRGVQQADFGYALTCHKAQGSQWKRVLIMEENVLNWPGKYEERARWMYTAVTRAVEKCTLIIGK